MAEIAYPFDAGPGATVGEAEWQRMAREWLRTGVLTGRLNQLAVSADGSALSVSVASGAAWIEGHYYRSDAAKALTIGTADPTNPRIDTVVARLDRTADTITTAVKAGTPAASPVAPALTQTDALYELPLADVRVDAAAGVIAAGKVTDRRAFTGPFDSAAYAPIAAIGARAVASAAQSIATGTNVPVALPTEQWDTDAFHDPAVNNSRFTVPAGRAGIYRLTGALAYASNSTGTRQARWHVNGIAIQGGVNLVPAATGGLTIVQSTVEVLLAVGDYVELVANQSSGGDLNTDHTFTGASVTRIGA